MHVARQQCANYLVRAWGFEPHRPATDYVPENRRRELCAGRVTINGRPATISGVQQKFALVRSLDGHYCAEWAWTTTERIVAQGGDFQL
jgi:hypothetical protein